VDLLSSSSGGDSGGDAMDPVMGGPPSGPLSPDLGARVPMVYPCSPMRIQAVKCGSNRHDDGGMEKNSAGSSLSSSSSNPPCPPPPSLMTKTTYVMPQLGWGTGLNCGQRMVDYGGLSVRSLSLRAQSASRPVALGSETVVILEPLR
jgi:hypothetical protein